MAAVMSSRRRLANRLMVACVVTITLIMLVPIYWIATTSFKSFNDSVAIPPKVLFEPELTGLVKVFTKRTQLRAQKYKITPQALAKIRDAGVPKDRTSRSQRRQPLNQKTQVPLSPPEARKTAKRAITPKWRYMPLTDHGWTQAKPW